jgi:hypothetical protein
MRLRKGQREEKREERTEKKKTEEEQREGGRGTEVKTQAFLWGRCCTR